MITRSRCGHRSNSRCRLEEKLVGKKLKELEVRVGGLIHRDFDVTKDSEGSWDREEERELGA